MCVPPNDCCVLAIIALALHHAIMIRGSLARTAVIYTLVGMGAMQQPVQSTSSLTEQTPCETLLRFHLARHRWMNSDSIVRNMRALKGMDMEKGQGRRRLSGDAEK